MEKRSSGCPDCLSAWFAVPTASRMESAQLGVAIDPLRSITCPSTMVDGAFGASLHAAHASSAAAIRIEFFICGPRGEDHMTLGPHCGSSQQEVNKTSGAGGTEVV